VSRSFVGALVEQTSWALVEQVLRVRPLACKLWFRKVCTPLLQAQTDMECQWVKTSEIPSISKATVIILLDQTRESDGISKSVHIVQQSRPLRYWTFLRTGDSASQWIDPALVVVSNDLVHQEWTSASEIPARKSPCLNGSTIRLWWY
jgi:hypothetical protein